MPQSSVFLCGTVFQDFVILQGKDPAELPKHLEAKGQATIIEHLQYILKFAKNNPGVANKSWPSLLKSQAFFDNVLAYIKGIRNSEKPAAATGEVKKDPPHHSKK